MGGLFLLLLLLPASCAATRATPDNSQESERTVVYTVALPAPQTQMAEISMLVAEVRGEVLEVAMPVWRPGRYQVLDFAGGVREIRAVNSDTGEALAIEKVDKSTWQIQTAGADHVRVDYSVYCNSLGDRTRHVDATHAFLSGVSVFLYAPDRRGDPVTVEIDAPEDWQIASGLEPVTTGPPPVLTAPNYDVLVDSPIEIGIHDIVGFEVAGLPHEIVIWGDPGAYDADRLIADFTKIVESQQSIWGGDLPYERYAFIVHAGRGASGGTEHLNSTVMQTSREALEGSTEESSDAYRRFLGLVSHEFFHTWNVKQLRPAGIHPYDYQRENYTDLLWVAEGTTSYYDDLTLARAGLIDAARYFDILAGLIDADRRRPGSLVQSLAESSFDAWIKFNRSTPDDVNSTVSFYDKGALVSLALDMEIRTRTENRVALDDVLRSMYEQFPLEGPGYTSDDLVGMVESLTESEFDEWFESFVNGAPPINYEMALETVGLELYFDPDSEQEDDEDDEAIPLRATLGMNLNGNIVRSVLSSGPAYHAGVIAGDEVVAINGRRIASADDVIESLEDLEPGDSIMFACFRHDVLHEIEIALAGEPDGEWRIRRVKEPADLQKAAYVSWLGHPWPED
jgi:predicted metalloprotease with PDZ domain